MTISTAATIGIDTVTIQKAVWDSTPGIPPWCPPVRQGRRETRPKGGVTHCHRGRGTTDPTMMSTLVELGADPNNRDERATTPLHWAARWTRNPAVITALLDAGATAHTRDEDGKRPSDYATQNEAIRHSEAYERLKNGAESA